MLKDCPSDPGCATGRLYRSVPGWKRSGSVSDSRAEHDHMGESRERARTSAGLAWRRRSRHQWMEARTTL